MLLSTTTIYLCKGWAEAGSPSFLRAPLDILLGPTLGTLTCAQLRPLLSSTISNRNGCRIGCRIARRQPFVWPLQAVRIKRVCAALPAPHCAARGTLPATAVSSRTVET